MSRVAIATSVLLLLCVHVSRAGVPACVGDCDGDGSIRIPELIRGVNIALGRAALDDCPSFDVNSDDRVGVNELISAVRSALQGCATPTAGPSPTPLAGLIEGEFFVLDAGTAVDVTGDLTIRVTGTVDIAANLVAGLTGGQSIDIDAGGDVTISGMVGAGSGGALAALSGTSGARTDGGSVVIRSRNGNITIASGARLAAGDGIAGGRGGDIALSAPNGAIFVAAATDVIHIGNGGDGNALTATDPASQMENLGNGGGDSGLLVFDAASISAPQLQEVTLSTAFAPGNGTISFPPGVRVSVSTSRTTISGGEGGDSGTFDAGDSGPSARAVDVASTNGPSPFEPLIRRGAPGGNGYFQGGDGADIALIGLDGISPGSDGQSVTAVGGDGGGCPVLYDIVFCTPGRGGDADAIAGRGADGDEGNDGGDGGFGTGIGGNSANRRDALAESTVFGQGGDGVGSGGDGGHGGDGCPPADAEDFGGDGGDGGGGDALGGNADARVPDELRGRSVATGGDGGDGGDGVRAGGFSGTFGQGLFLREAEVLRMSSAIFDGFFGADGRVCATPTVPPFTPEATATPTPTFTPTPTRTHTPTPTRTHTPTPTPTPLPTSTPSPTSPTVDTPTALPTPTAPECEELAVGTAVAPQGFAGHFYSLHVPVTAGVAPFTMTLESASDPLPDGLTINGTTIAGFPFSVGTFTVTVRISDGCDTPQTAVREVTFTINPDPAGCAPISLQPLPMPPVGRVGDSYFFTPPLVGGEFSFGMRVAAGRLPPGLTISGLNIIGAPRQPGGSTAVLEVTDGCDPTPQIATRAYGFTVLPGPDCPPLGVQAQPPPAQGTVGVSYTFTPNITGGRTPMTVEIVQDSGVDTTLPPGLFIDNQTGDGIPIVAGAPLEAVTRQVVLRITDSCETGAQAIDQFFTFVVNPDR